MFILRGAFIPSAPYPLRRRP